MGLGLGAASPAPANPNKDLEVTSPPADSVSSLHFSPVANHLLATSWDGQVRCASPPSLHGCCSVAAGLSAWPACVQVLGDPDHRRVRA